MAEPKDPIDQPDKAIPNQTVGSAQSMSDDPFLPSSEFDPGLEAAFEPSQSTVRRVERAVESAGMVIAGKYKLIQQIGEGGMGSVWLAEQREPVKRNVALKLIKTGMDSKSVLARFEAERQALALMDHPNIARILDGGLTETGSPYFAMELVKGVPITKFCDAQRLTPKQRLELFIPVCQAIQHAHQKGIIHRDIKPSNVMVALYDDKPVPKVIDFGLAKATGQSLTEQTLNTGFNVVGTPQYMSPEQATLNQLDIDTRSDIYSLGILLYELLAGSPPFKNRELEKAGFLEILRVIREEEPPRPSTKLSSSEGLPSISACRGTEPKKLTGLLRNELDWIVMKSLEKDRKRRYETANGFAADIQRYLAGEAVLAHPPSRRYRLQKIIRKNKGPVLAASLVALALIAGMVGTSWGFFRARDSAEAERIAKLDAQEKQADAETARSEAETQRIEAITQKTRAETREQEAIDAVRRFGDAVSNNPELKNNPALESLRKELLQEPLAFFQSLRTRLQSDPSSSRDALVRLAEAAFDLGKLTEEIGDQQNALTVYQHSFAIFERLNRENPAATEFQLNMADCLHNIGILRGQTGKSREAILAYEQVREIRQRFVQVKPTDTELLDGLAGCLNDLGVQLSATGSRVEALSHFQQAREIQERLVKTNPTVAEFQNRLATILANIGAEFSDIGANTEAIAVIEQARDIGKQLVQSNPNGKQFQFGLANSHYNLGVMLHQTGNVNNALIAYEEAREFFEQLANDNPTVTAYQNRWATCLNNIGLLLGSTGKSKEGIASFKQAQEVQERLVNDNPTVTEFQVRLAHTLNNTGSLLNQTGEAAEALAAYKRSCDILQQLAEANPTVTDFQSKLASGLNNLGIILNETGKSTESLVTYKKAVEIQEQLVQAHPTITDFQLRLANTHINIGVLQFQIGNSSEALAAYEKAREINQRLVTIDPTVTEYQNGLATSYYNIADVLGRTGKFNESIAAAEQARDVWKRLVDANPDVTEFQSALAGTQYNIGISLSESGNPDKALAAFEQARKIHERLMQGNPASLENQVNFANTCGNIADVLAATGKPGESLAALEHAIEVREQLAQRHPDNSEFQSTLAKSYLIKGNLLDQSRGSPDSQQAFDNAREILERLVQTNPDVIDFQVSLIMSVHNAVTGDLRAERFSSARDRVKNAIAYKTKVLATNQHDPNLRQYSTGIYTCLKIAADGLSDAELRREADVALAELAMTDPKAARLERRLNELIEGIPPRNARELLRVALRAYETRRFTLAARFWSEALAMDESLSENRTDQHAYNAACAATLAASGQGIEEPLPDETAQKELRAKALQWLMAEFDRWQQLAETDSPDHSKTIAETLAHWQQDSDLSSIRETAELEKLTPPERESWETLWKKVTELVERLDSQLE